MNEVDLSKFGSTFQEQIEVVVVHLPVGPSINQSTFISVFAGACDSATVVHAFIRLRGLFSSFCSEAARPARKV